MLHALLTRLACFAGTGSVPPSPEDATHDAPPGSRKTSPASAPASARLTAGEAGATSTATDAESQERLPGRLNLSSLRERFGDTTAGNAVPSDMGPRALPAPTVRTSPVAGSTRRDAKGIEAEASTRPEEDWLRSAPGNEESNAGRAIHSGMASSTTSHASGARLFANQVNVSASHFKPVHLQSVLLVATHMHH